MNLKKHLHWLLYLLFVISCARQSAPTGGPQDSIPPVLLRSSPPNEAINFKGRVLEFTFSELIQLNVPKEQLIITPTVGKDYDIKARNNKVLLTLDKDLADSTTYTINFREAVADITERNPAENLRIAISTGNYIDSLSIEGTVKNLLDQKSLKDATVALHVYTDTFSILKHPAVYLTKSDENGLFKLENIKPGNYAIYALIDQNRNLIVDSKNEPYAFLSEPLKLDSLVKNVNLQLIKLDARELKMTSARPYNTYFNIRSSKNLKKATLQALDSSFLFYSFGEDKQNILLYNSFDQIDSLEINVTLEDSIQNKFDTTLFAKFTTKDATPEKFSMDILSTTLIPFKGIFKTEIKFTKPIKEVNFDNLLFKIDSLNSLTFKQEDLNYDLLNKILSIEKKFDSKIYKSEEIKQDPEASIKGEKTRRKQLQNQLYLGKGAFISIEQDSSRKFKQNVRAPAFEDLGIIATQIYAGNTKVIIQLLNSKKNIIASVTHKNKATFEDLEPNDYLLRIILDRNGNGIWDPGNYLKKEEPEDIVYYENENHVREIKLKANFEIGPLLITY